MSGTSLDGLDMALCRFSGDESNLWQFDLLDAITFPYSPEIVAHLEDAHLKSALELAQFEIELTNLWVNYIHKFINKTSYSPDLIAMHGHTIFHQPRMGLTFQIGKGAIVAARCGVTTICDFRSGDVALGGQGAPLVPIGDELLFPQYDACLNLGGIANISYRIDSKRIAYDISPCNMPLNYLAQWIGEPFDRDGNFAQQGIVVEPLLFKLNHLEYYRTTGAKSLGKEWVSEQLLPLLTMSGLSAIDLLRTVSEHIAIQIANEIQKAGAKSVLCTGGGAKNRLLINLIREKTTAKLIVPETTLVDYKEAIIFAFLGVLRLRGDINCLKEVTGATKNSCGGAIYLP
jgi:anhydro-N-acetylmuramic acid kinase